MRILLVEGGDADILLRLRVIDMQRAQVSRVVLDLGGTPLQLCAQRRQCVAVVAKGSEIDAVVLDDARGCSAEQDSQLGYGGLLMTDDLSMKALSGTMTEKVQASLDAGVDMVLHCNGVLAEMEEVAAAAGPLKGKALARAKAALRARRKPLPYDEKVALRDLEAVLKAGVKTTA